MQGINKAKLTQVQKDKLDDLIRCSIFDIVRADEVQGLIDEGIMKSIDELPEFHDLCSCILSHKCNSRCLRRIGPGNDSEDFQCRKTNNLKVSPDNTSHCFMKLPVNYSKDCVDRLIKCGIAEPCQDNGSGVSFTSSHPLFNPVKHIPPTNPTNDKNLSPVTGKTMIVNKSMQNTQWLTLCAGLNKYICKYIGSIDEKARVQLRISSHNKGTVLSKATFLHNTKITSSKKMRILQEIKKKVIRILKLG